MYHSETHLAPLQGSNVPLILGAHIDATSVSLNMRPPDKHLWIGAHPSMPKRLAEAAVAALARIHARGVLHGSLAPHHILTNASERVTIVDFTRARVRTPLRTPLGDVPRAAPEDFAAEMRALKAMLRRTAHNAPPPQRVTMPMRTVGDVRLALNDALSAYDKKARRHLEKPGKKNYGHLKRMRENELDVYAEAYRKRAKYMDAREHVFDAVHRGDPAGTLAAEQAMRSVVEELAEEMYPADLYPELQDQGGPPILTWQELHQRPKPALKGVLHNKDERTPVNRKIICDEDNWCARADEPMIESRWPRPKPPKDHAQTREVPTLQMVPGIVTR